MTRANLHPFLRPGLDILFVALNPPAESNAHGHWFSGKQSRFFDLMFQSGLITARVNKLIADDIVFGTTDINFLNANFGVVDLVPNVVETDSTKVKPSRRDVATLVEKIVDLQPKTACVLHSRVRVALDRYANLARPLQYGNCGPLLGACRTHVVLSSFPSGSSIPDTQRLLIWNAMKAKLNADA